MSNTITSAGTPAGLSASTRPTDTCACPALLPESAGQVHEFSMRHFVDALDHFVQDAQDDTYRFILCDTPSSAEKKREMTITVLAKCLETGSPQLVDFLETISCRFLGDLQTQSMLANVIRNAWPRLRANGTAERLTEILQRLESGNPQAYPDFQDQLLLPTGTWSGAERADFIRLVGNAT